MRYKQLGNTGLFVSEICLGGMTFGQEKVGIFGAINGLDQAGVDAIVERSLAAGVNFIDTANAYTAGESERLLGQAVRNLGIKRSDVVIATKFQGPMGPGPNDRGASRAHIMYQVDESLVRLQMDHIDLYQIHGNETIASLEEILRALDDLVRVGKVRYVGVSNWQAWRMAKALGVSAAKDLARFETVQAYYSIASRDLEREIVPFLTEEKLGLMVWSPLAGGLLSGKYGPGGEGEGRRATFDFPPVERDRAWACVAAMREVARKHETSVATVALAYVLAKPFVMSMIIGAKNTEQLDQNLAATRLTLDADDLAKLDEVSALRPEYPSWMLARHSANRPPAPFVAKG